jgi:hypothetical protein
VAGLGLRYLHISSLLMFGHPLRKPFLVAFNNVDISGLHREWCTNLIALARVLTECVNAATLIPSCICALTSDRFVSLLQFMGSVHRSVEGSFRPRNITLPLYITLQYSLQMLPYILQHIGLECLLMMQSITLSLCGPSVFAAGLGL